MIVLYCFDWQVMRPTWARVVVVPAHRAGGGPPGRGRPLVTVAAHSSPSHCRRGPRRGRVRRAGVPGGSLRGSPRPPAAASQPPSPGTPAERPQERGGTWVAVLARPHRPREGPRSTFRAAGAGVPPGTAQLRGWLGRCRPAAGAPRSAEAWTGLRGCHPTSAGPCSAAGWDGEFLCDILESPRSALGEASDFV